MMQDTEPLELVQEITSRYRTVHRFCKAHGELNRSTVYMVLKGRYPGNVERQLERMRQALRGEVSVEERAYQAIRETACARCTVTNQGCRRCETLFRALARAVAAAISNHT
ncbi:hypothetical protein Dde_3359 [Oleidesulfovibrio alaskensis G20]|jgi:response regulator RpfG family c-di-GMP phosphodiesterase|uniref:Uncharacterized protein n=1 Tax=Oleidesulfovibrio alaskensis (strain ATCC BAA-1058 / DSM 17464 / G20) TaxID=207559 RepID=Q30VZ3_OLEA2|nr:hypothetical protein Dde_3359 [Oleidesulfovibrio alaskensis G20]MBL3587975.1 hypothetical protein [bacterium]